MKKDIIQALLDGKPIQFNRYNQDTYWVDLDILQPEFYPSNNPRIYADLFVDDSAYNWRIKQDIKMLACRLALMKSSSEYYTATADSYEEEKYFETDSEYFVKWLTDWVNYSVET